MKTRKIRMSLSLFIPVILLALLVTAVNPASAHPVPIITITGVVDDTSVTIYGYHFPADQTFTVRMGAYGTYALGGTVVGTKDPSSGSAFTATYTIPDGLKGLGKIAIRLDSPQGFYSYNWFYNNSTTPAPPPVPGYYGFPTFSISSVEEDTSVTIVAYNLPPDETFTVRMGKYGTLGVGGIVVDTLDSDDGGTQTATFTIPSELAGKNRIAIRMDSSTGYYYAYNWFYNNTATVPVPPAPPVPEPVYYGVPTIHINAVVKDDTVTLTGYNFPADQEFTVKMGYYGTMGIGGIVVDSYDSGDGGSFSATYDIPAALHGQFQIAIRLETASGYYYAYNWFYNNTTY